MFMVFTSPFHVRVLGGQEMSILDQRCCDIVNESTNTQTIREFIYDLDIIVYKKHIPDEELNKMSDNEIIELVEELDWLGWK